LFPSRHLDQPLLRPVGVALGGALCEVWGIGVFGGVEVQCIRFVLPLVEATAAYQTRYVTQTTADEGRDDYPHGEES